VTKKDTKYEYDLSKDEQKNATTGFIRKIRRCCPLWEYEEFGVWKLFNPAANKTAEQANSAGRTTASCTFHHAVTNKDTTYDYDLSKNEQKNTATGFIRKIRRRLEYGSGGVGPTTDSDDDAPLSLSTIIL